MKKIYKIIFAILFLAVIVVFVLLALSQFNIKTSLNEYWYNDENKEINNSEIIRCSYNPIYPIVAFVSDHILLEDIEELKVYIYKIENIFSKKEENREFIGVTTIKNTTFPELVKMVKEDCSQFQEGHGDYYGEDMAWSYSPYEPEPEKTPEEIAEDEYEEWVNDAIYEMRMDNKN